MKVFQCSEDENRDKKWERREEETIFWKAVKLYLIFVLNYGILDLFWFSSFGLRD